MNQPPHGITAVRGPAPFVGGDEDSMANLEMQLVSRIVHSGDISTVLDWGISAHDFRTAEGRGLFNQLLTFYSSPLSRGSSMGPNLFRHLFTVTPLTADVSVATEVLCAELRKCRVIAEGKEIATELHESLELDPDTTLSAMFDKLQKLIALGTAKNTDVYFGDAVNRLYEKYEHMEKYGAQSFNAVQWPWEILNEVAGITFEDYIVLYGRPKSMKTWVLAEMIAWTFQTEKRALIYTKEMTPDNIFQRAAACVAKLPYSEMRSAKLTVEEKHMYATLREMAHYNKTQPICLSGREAPPGGDTVAWIQSKAEKYKPDVIFIDGMYLLSDPSGSKVQDWQRVTNISRAIRGMVLSLKIPAICTMQANRKAAQHSSGNLDEIAYADAVGQDATVAIRVINEKSSPTIALVIAGSREFNLHGIRIHGEPASNFRFHSVMTEKDIQKATERDSNDEEPEDPANHSKPRKAAKAGKKTDAQRAADLADEQMKMITP